MLTSLQPKNKVVLTEMYNTAPNIAILFQKLGLEVLEEEIIAIPKPKNNTTKERAEALATKILGNNMSIGKTAFINAIMQQTNCNENKAMLGFNYMVSENVVNITNIVIKSNPFYSGLEQFKEMVYIENFF